MPVRGHGSGVLATTFCVHNLPTKLHPLQTRLLPRPPAPPSLVVGKHKCLDANICNPTCAMPSQIYDRSGQRFVHAFITHTQYSTATCGGSANGAPCVFPFTYKGTTYTKCTSVDHSQAWCRTSKKYANQWGNCDCGGTSVCIHARETKSFVHFGILTSQSMHACGRRHRQASR